LKIISKKYFMLSTTYDLTNGSSSKNISMAISSYMN
jgi:hypothetical protein